MRYRADLIGGALTVRAGVNGGTEVICAVRTQEKERAKRGSDGA